MNIEEVKLSKEEIKEKIRKRYEGVDPNLLEVIPAKEKPKLSDTNIERRVAIYVRVSTDDPNQTSSFELQKNHYCDDVISKNPSYNLVGIYADEGISGTSMAKRKEFNRMIDDCHAGKIDLIITKSLSRFARNLVDTVTTIRDLAQLRPPVGVLFETENIFTLDKDKEVILSILATLAQEESHIKSDIMNASLVWRFSRGIFLTPVLLGYDHDIEGNLIVNELEAKTVRLIFFMYLYGHSCKEIADILTDIGRKTKKGNMKWNEGSICNILRNERYCGDVLTWKTVTTDYITHKKQRNMGDRIQHRQRDHHEPIIRRDDFIAVQHMLENAKYGNKSIMPELEVIREGSLTGFVSVNPRWCSFKTDEYIAACNDADNEEKPQEDILIEADTGEFDFRGFEVARSQFFDTTNKMCVTFDSKGVQFSTTCVKKFQNNQYIEILVHPIKKLIVVRSSNKKVRNSMRWAKIDGLGNTVARKISGAAFMPTLYELFEWNADFKYRIRGVTKQKDNTSLMIFDIKDATIFVPQPVTEGNNGGNLLGDVTPVVPKTGKSIVAFPSAWANSFGNDFYNQTHITPLKIAEKNGVDAEAIPFGESELEITAPDVVADNIQILMEDMKQEDLTNGNSTTYNE